MMAAGKKKPEEKNPHTPGSERSLRDAAEEQHARIPRSSPGLKGRTTERLVHELQVHPNEIETTAEEVLKSSEMRYRRFFEAVRDGILILDAETGTILDVNPFLIELLGFTHEQFLGKKLWEIGVFKDIAASKENFKELQEKKYNRFEDLPLETADGRRIYAEFFSFVYEVEGKNVMQCNIRDITDRKKAESALRESEEKFRNVFDWADDAVMLHTLTTENSPGRFIDVNRVACRMLGYTREELLTRGPPDIVPAEFHPLLGEIVLQARTTESVMFETRFQRKDGMTFPVESSGHLVTFEGKGIWISHIRDITERKQAEEMRERLISELAQKNAELDRFTYTVSHDLKSPLIAIRAFLSLLEGDLKSGKAEQVQTDITRISESAEKLESLINTLLALSRSGRSVDAPVRIPFSDLAHEAAGLLEPSWRKRGVSVVIPDSMPVLSGDRQRLLQVMTNLIDNAVRFMGDQQEPRIEIGVRDDAGIPVFFVWDNGMGIKKENLSRVFGLFERFNPDIPGTGIGLATVKRIIEAHGGRIWAESEGPGKGTTFRFTLPGAVKDRDKQDSEQV